MTGICCCERKEGVFVDGDKICNMNQTANKTNTINLIKIASGFNLAVRLPLAIFLGELNYD